MCKVLEVSKSAFYAWQRKPKQDAHSELRQAIREAHARSRQAYGSRRVLPAVREIGFACGKNLVIRLMREENLRGKMKRLRPYGKQPKEVAQEIPNRLARNFKVKAVNQVWLSDITYIWTLSGWVYLAVLLDLCSRKVVGWSVSMTPDTNLILKALWNAVGSRGLNSGLVIHHDQGCQYTSHQWKAAVSMIGATISMSGRGQCWDNAPMESWNGTLKRESDIVSRTRKNMEEVESALFQWIESWYNTQRLHSKLKYVSPVHFEQNLAA